MTTLSYYFQLIRVKFTMFHHFLPCFHFFPRNIAKLIVLHCCTLFFFGVPKHYHAASCFGAPEALFGIVSLNLGKLLVNMLVLGQYFIVYTYLLSQTAF